MRPAMGAARSTTFYWRRRFSSMHPLHRRMAYTMANLTQVNPKATNVTFRRHRTALQHASTEDGLWGRCLGSRTWGGGKERRAVSGAEAGRSETPHRKSVHGPFCEATTT
jgi:hypothetical protein